MKIRLMKGSKDHSQVLEVFISLKPIMWTVLKGHIMVIYISLIHFFSLLH
jgi:hypothetical protein